MKEDKVKQASLIDVEPDKTVVKGISLGAFAMGTTPSAVDIKNGKMVRIRPLHYDWQYTLEELNPWKLTVRGKEFKPILKSLQTPFALAYKKRTYSPNRIKYPLKRVDWDPKGERHPENRGKSKYKRISWDEATNIIVSEINVYRKSMDLMQYWLKEKDMEKGKLCMVRMAAKCCFWRKWAVIPWGSGIRTAGRAGTGERCMSGERWW